MDTPKKIILRSIQRLGGNQPTPTAPETPETPRPHTRRLRYFRGDLHGDRQLDCNGDRREDPPREEEVKTVIGRCGDRREDPPCEEEVKTVIDRYGEIAVKADAKAVKGQPLSNSWTVVGTSTIATKDLFWLSDGEPEGHIATIRIGRSINPARFRQALKVIALAPQMLILLCAAMKYLQTQRSHDDSSREKLIKAIKALLVKAVDPRDQSDGREGSLNGSNG